MSQFNVSNTHSLIPNAREYMFQKKYISINANDRDIIKFPSSASFEIELPQDYVNVQTIKINSWSFPSFYPTFLEMKFNIDLLFKITEPYVPSPTDAYLTSIYAGLCVNLNTYYIATINEGFYTGSQMAKELTNSMNKEMTCHLTRYLQGVDISYAQIFVSSGGYTDFVVVFNEVSKKLLFGNRSSGFEIIGNKKNYKCSILENNTICQHAKISPSFANWGLPWYLGFENCNYESKKINPYYQPTDSIPPIYDKNMTPQLTYLNNTDASYYWLQPSKSNSFVYVIECPLVINIETDNEFFIEVSGLNTLDETKPFQVSEYTKTTNGTIGVINSAFAKVYISKNSVNLGGYYGILQPIYKYFDPPAERLRRFCITLRYHDGRPVFFGNQDFNIMFELGLLTPHNEKRMSIQIPESVKHFF